MMTEPTYLPQRIISGGQTGADRAALDAAIELRIPHGGFVPARRRAEDGPIADHYDVTELPSDSYDERTEQNVLSADATLIVSVGPLTGGSATTKRMARRHGKECLQVNLARLSEDEAVEVLREWLAEVRPAVLNVAGPRESTTPGIYDRVRALLRAALSP